MQQQLLLIEDVDDLGRSGDVVTVKPGYARNFLIPQKKAVVMSKLALRMRARLVEERKKQAAVDFAEAEALASRLSSLSFGIEVKVDPEGKLYGSVTAVDVVKILEKEGVEIEKRSVVLAHPIKELGDHTIKLKLKEGVLASFVLSIRSDRPGANSSKVESQKETSI
jgi:large subunit ribosomal protein L9